MGLFSRKKNNKQPSSNPSRAESPSPSDAYSRAESPLPPVPGRSSTSSHFGSTSSLPPNFAHPEPIPQTRRVPDEPYVLPSLSLSPLGIQPIRTRSSSDGRLPGEGVRDSFVLVPPLGLDEDDDDAPLGWRANQNPKAMRFFGLDKDEAARPATVSEDGHGSRGSLGGGEAEGYDFRFTDSPVGGSSRGVAGEQERFIKGTSPSSTFAPLPRTHPTTHQDSSSDKSHSYLSKKSRSPLPPPLLSFSPPERTTSLPHPASPDVPDVLDEPPHPAFAEEGASSSTSSSTGKAAGKRRFMGIFTGSRESLAPSSGAADVFTPAGSTSSLPPTPITATTLTIPANPHTTTTSPLSASTPALPSPSIATPRPQRPHAVSRPSSSFLFNALKIGSRGTQRTSSPSNDKDDDGLPLRPPSPASSFRLISARHITTPPPPSTEELMATPAVAPQRPLYPRGRSQSVEWTGISSALVGEDDDDEENLVEEKRVPVAVFRRRQSEVGLNGATGLELDLGASKPPAAGPSMVEREPMVDQSQQPELAPSFARPSLSPTSSTFARNKGFVVASRTNRNTITSVPSSSASSTHSQETRPPPKSNSNPTFGPSETTSPPPMFVSPVELSSPLPTRPPRATSRPLSSPPSSPPRAYRAAPPESTHARRPSSSFFPLEPDYNPFPIEELTSPVLGSARPASRSSSHLPPPPPPVGSQPLANSPKPISRYHAAKASKPPPPPAPVPKPVTRRHYSSTEEESSESAASSDDDEPNRTHRRDRTAGSRSSFSSNKTFTRGQSSSHAEPAPRTKSPSASMFSSSGNGKRRPVGKPLMDVEGVEMPILDRRTTLRRASAADVDRAVEEHQPRLPLAERLRRGSESVVAKMELAPKQQPAPVPAPASAPAAVGDDSESDGYGQDDPTPPTNKQAIAATPVAGEESDDDDKPLGMITRTAPSPAVPSLNLPASSPRRGRETSETAAPSISPSKSTPSSLGLRDPSSQPFLSRSPHRSTSSLSVAPSTASSASSYTSSSKPRSILRNPISPPSATVTLPTSTSTRPPPSRSMQSPSSTASKLVVNTATGPPGGVLPSPPGTSSGGYSSNPSSPLPPPERISGSSLNRSAASPSSSLTGDSSSGRTPLTPREGAERDRARDRSGLGVGKRWGESTPADSVPLKPIDEDEAERRRKERRRGEARNAIELGNVFHGPPPVDPDSETETPMANQLDPHQQQYPYAPNPYAGQPQFGPGGYPTFMQMGGMPDPTSTWALQAQIQAQQAQMMAMQMAMQAQMGGGDPNMHYQSMMMAKQQFQAQMAAQAAQLAGEQWEMSSNMGGPMSEAGGSVLGGPPSIMGHPASMAFPGMMGGFGGGGGPGYAASAYGGGGGSNWGGSDAGGGWGGGARSEYGGGGSRSGYGGGPARTRHQSGSGLSMMYPHHHQHQSPPQHPNQLRASPSDYFARNQQLPNPGDASGRQRQVSQPASQQQGPSSGRPPPTSRSSQSFFKETGTPEPARQSRRRDKSGAAAPSTSPGTNTRPLSIIAPPSRPFVDDEPSSGGRSPGGGGFGGRSTPPPPSSWGAGSPVAGEGGRRRR